MSGMTLFHLIFLRRRDECNRHFHQWHHSCYVPTIKNATFFLTRPHSALFTLPHMTHPSVHKVIWRRSESVEAYDELVLQFKTEPLNIAHERLLDAKGQFIESQDADGKLVSLSLQYFSARLGTLRDEWRKRDQIEQIYDTISDELTIWFFPPSTIEWSFVPIHGSERFSTTSKILGASHVDSIGALRVSNASRNVSGVSNDVDDIQSGFNSLSLVDVRVE